jgi:Ca2+-binding EF-hand superfamily protein
MRHGDAALGLLFVLILGSDPGLAQMRGQGREAGLAYRIPDRFFALDINRDGNITRDEMNRAEGMRFASAAHGRNVMKPEEFAALYMQLSRGRTDALFRRLDWNADGKLSLEEYAAPLRARFEAFEDGHGEEACANAHVVRASLAPASRESGRGRFCDDNDLNRDGKVTRAELDSVIAKTFSLQMGSAKSMTLAQYRAAADGRDRPYAVQAFQRLDADGDGRLSFAEFAASDQRLFARLDTNKDGVVTRDELALVQQSGHNRFDRR